MLVTGATVTATVVDGASLVDDGGVSVDDDGGGFVVVVVDGDVAFPLPEGVFVPPVPPSPACVLSVPLPLLLPVVVVGAVVLFDPAWSTLELLVGGAPNEPELLPTSAV